MEEVTTAVSAVYKGAQYIKNKLDNSKDMGTIHGSMMDAMALLLAEKTDHEKKIQRHVTKTSSEVGKVWDSSVDKIEDEVEKLDKKFAELSEKSPTLNVRRRSNLTDKMRKKAGEVLDLCKRGVGIRDSIIVDKDPERVVLKEAPDIKGFKTLQQPLEQILGWLAEDSIKGIEVSGSIGCGKTAIMLNVNNHKKVDELFDIVIWVKVSTEDDVKNSSTEHLQKVIIQRLKLQMDGTNGVDDVAESIKSVLKTMKYLILLDDVKQEMNLEQIGIPLTGAKVGSKIVWTRVPQNLYFQGLVSKRVKVQKLSEKEAWEMFQTILGCPDLQDYQHIQQSRRKVLKMVGAVPLMIKMVAVCLRDRISDAQNWNDGLHMFWPNMKDKRMPEFIHLVNFCYGNLINAEKNCFLYSALYPEESDIYMAALLDNWGGENFLRHTDDDAVNVHAKARYSWWPFWGQNIPADSDDVAEDVHVKARDIMRYFLKMLFLEEGINKQFVQMPKWIRRAALDIMEDDNKRKYLVKTSEALKNVTEEHWEQKNWISLIDNSLETLPGKPDCSMLSTLLVQENLSLTNIPPSLFNCVKNLRVLGLNRTGLKSLPPSLSKLKLLKVLNLNGCIALGEFPSHVLELLNLEVLDIRDTGVNKIPPEIKCLTKLRRLLLSFTSPDNAGVISEISLLKELVFDAKFPQQSWLCMLHEVLSILTALKQLTSLQYCFQDHEQIDVIQVIGGTVKISARADYVNSFIQNRNESPDTSFQVFVDCPVTTKLKLTSESVSDYQWYVKYCNGNSCDDSVLNGADALEIVNHSTFERLSDFEASNLSGIKGCRIEMCEKIVALDSLILSKLEQLYLSDLPELVSIWGGDIELGSLPELTTLALERCPKLIKIFPPDAVEKLIQTSLNTAKTPCVFPKLKKIIIAHMPKLTHVYQNGLLEWPSLETVRVTNCPNLSRHLLTSSAKAPMLTLIEDNKLTMWSVNSFCNVTPLI